MIPERFKLATSLLLLAPVCAGFGSWLILQAVVPLDHSPTNIVALTEIGLGVLFFALAFPLFFPSLGVFASRNNAEGERWVRWLRRWKPRWQGLQTSVILGDDHRRYALIILVVIFVQALLLIPGIGEDRRYPLNQFYGLFSSLWYFYSLAILLSSFILIYYKRPGGYLLGIILSIISVGTTIPDVIGLLPPSAPTLRTTILALSVLPPDVVLAYVSSRAIQRQVHE